MRDDAGHRTTGTLPGSAMDALREAREEIRVLRTRLASAQGVCDDWRARHAVAIDQRDRAFALIHSVESRVTYRLRRAVLSLLTKVLRKAPAGARRVVGRTSATGARQRCVAETGGTDPAKPTLPVHVHMALGLGPTELGRFVRAVRQAALITQHSPVVVTDCPAFSSLRKLGVVIEYVPSRQQWADHGVEVRWQRMLEERMAQIAVDHRARRTIGLDLDEPLTVSRLVILNS